MTTKTTKEIKQNSTTIHLIQTKVEKRDKKKDCMGQKTNNKIVDLNQTMSIITLTINGLGHLLQEK